MKLNTKQLAALLADMAANVTKRASFDGTITYEALPEPDEFEVSAFYRVGNDEGQGGSISVPASKR